MAEVIGLGVYTPAEAGRLLHVPPARISRWLRGHSIGDRSYGPLWSPQIDLQDGNVYLGFRDLMEVRVADRFIGEGVSPQRVRAAIKLARDMIGEERPLSTDRFRTDGRDIFLEVIDTDEHGAERERLLNLFKRQYEFRQIIDPILKTIEFDDQGLPHRWWPLGKRESIVVDPLRAFGQPIDAETSVPTRILAMAAQQNSPAMAAKIYVVSAASVRRAMQFESKLGIKAAA